jgi:hypothetical protein
MAGIFLISAGGEGIKGEALNIRLDLAHPLDPPTPARIDRAPVVELSPDLDYSGLVGILPP